MTMTSETSQTAPQVTLEGSVTITGALSGLPPCESGTTVVQMSGGSLLAGSPVSLPGSTLPANYKWADRSVVLFADWPDLQAVYQAGLLDVLPVNATEEEKAANPRKWVLNGCGNGLFLPDIGGRFAREWRPGQTNDAERAAGSRQGDAIRNIKGGLTSPSAYGAVCYVNCPNDPASPMYIEKKGKGPTVGAGNGCGNVYFDASRAVPTADENRPLNDAQPVAIYMGRRAQDLQ